MDKEVAMALGRMSEKINDVAKRVDDMMQMLNTQREADIDFIAMETDVDLDQEDEDGTF